MQRKKLEELNLLDDFLFNALMTYPEFGEKFIQNVLKLIFNKEFHNLKVVAQKSYGGINTDLRGARLDVYVEDDDIAEIGSETLSSVYDLEPDKNGQKKYVVSFPKRARFYHAVIDSRSLKAGENFGKLKNVFVIFICNYDPFGYGRMKYTIKNICIEEPEMPYDDGAQTIVLYTKGTKGECSDELFQFLSYMENTTQVNAVNDTLKEIQNMVDVVKRDGEVSLSYMKGFERDAVMYEEGRRDEQKNTERERIRAERAENEKKQVENEKKQADAKIAELELELKRLKCMQKS